MKYETRKIKLFNIIDILTIKINKELKAGKIFESKLNLYTEIRNRLKFYKIDFYWSNSHRERLKQLEEIKTIITHKTDILILNKKLNENLAIKSIKSKTSKI